MKMSTWIGAAWLAGSLAGCFSPDLRDCTVTCAGTDECGGDQICAGGFCRAEGATCQGSGSGSGSDPAPTKVTLRVDVTGEGKVVVAGVGTCSTADPNEGHCSFMVPQGAHIQLDAMRLEDTDFDRWTTSNCEGHDPSCMLTLTTETFVGAKFR